MMGIDVDLTGQAAAEQEANWVPSAPCGTTIFRSLYSSWLIMSMRSKISHSSITWSSCKRTAFMSQRTSTGLPVGLTCPRSLYQSVKLVRMPGRA